MSLAERVGQLFMVDCPSSGVRSATVTAITRFHVGAVILDGTTRAGLGHIATVTAQLRSEAPREAGLLIATDQEGGQVQRLQGPGFSSIPSGLEQGRIAAATLRRDAAGWARELHAAGVNVNLAPVLDTVPAQIGSNPPIGDLGREYGHNPHRVTRHGIAFARGMADGGVAATAKHFPGLGRVHGNTDVSSGVHDRTTTRQDAYLAPFAAAADAGVPLMMVSTAIYDRIDPGVPAAFSHTIVTGMLRDSLGFQGVIISDDLGAAQQVASYSPGQRAVNFIAAGGDIVLTVDPGVIDAMSSAVLTRAKSDPDFREQVDAAALRVLRLKQAHGLLQ